MMIVFGKKKIPSLNSAKDMRKLPFFNSDYFLKIHIFTPPPPPKQDQSFTCYIWHLT